MYERPNIRKSFRDADAPGDGAPQDHAVAIQNMRLDKRDFDQHGCTERCVQREYVRRIGCTQPGRIHTAECHARIIEAISQTDDRIRAAAPSAAPFDFLPAEPVALRSPSRAEVRRPAPAHTTNQTSTAPSHARAAHARVPSPSIGLQAIPREENDAAGNNDADMQGENENPLPDGDDADDEMLSHMMFGHLQPAHTTTYRQTYRNNWANSFGNGRMAEERLPTKQQPHLAM